MSDDYKDTVVDPAKRLAAKLDELNTPGALTREQLERELEAIRMTVGETEFYLRQQLAASQARCLELERDKEQAVYALGQLKEAADSLTCEVCKMDMQRALKGA